MEAHFDKVEEHKMVDEKSFMEALQELMASYERGVDAKDEDKGEDKPSAQQTRDMDYADTLTKAMEDARSGEAFVVLVASAEEYQGAQIIVPHIYLHSKRDDAALLLDAATADFVAQSYSRLITDFIQARRDDGESGT